MKSESAVVDPSGVKKAEVDISPQHFEALAAAVLTVCGSCTQSRTIDFVRRDCRYSQCAETGSMLACIKKERLVVCDIAVPNSRYDLRLSLCQELPVGESGELGYKREKRRRRMTVDPFAYDFTIVKSGSKETFEVEIELDPKLIAHREFCWVEALLSRGFHLLSLVNG